AENARARGGRTAAQPRRAHHGGGAGRHSGHQRAGDAVRLAGSRHAGVRRDARDRNAGKWHARDWHARDWHASDRHTGPRDAHRRNDPGHRDARYRWNAGTRMPPHPRRRDAAAV
ncbi:MAG: hypothetical protein AVDCRST_MAG87-3113, partial [uncultured Thermomicrobiales bacterium]